MTLGFIILAHNQPDSIRRLTDILATGDDRVVIHFDSSASAADKEAVGRIAAERPDRIRVISKVRCVWGEWSLVEAVLQSLGAFAEMPEPPDYIHLMSAADFPTRPVAELKEFLRRNPDRDFIECCDITQGRWVKGGLSRERLRFFYPFNFRTSRRAFDRMVRWQRKLKIRRRMPLHLKPHMGSQWWTMRWTTCAKVLEFTAKNPVVRRFFRSTWIPDESFFQTIVAKVVPGPEIANLQLMFHHLGATGRPYVFYNDHLPLLRKLPHFFIRKVSPQAGELHGGLPAPRAGRPIPKPKHLARVRDLLRYKIDENHLFKGVVPGYIDTSEEPVPVLEEQPLVLYLVTAPELIPRLEEITRTGPACFWLGRPFAPKELQMPHEALARIGMTSRSWKLRDAFLKDFIRLLAGSAPGPAIPAAVLVIGADYVDLEALGMLSRVIPVVVSDPPLAPHRISLLAGVLHDACPGLHARTLHLGLPAIPGFLRGLAADPPPRGGNVP